MTIHWPHGIAGALAGVDTCQPDVPQIREIKIDPVKRQISVG